MMMPPCRAELSKPNLAYGIISLFDGVSSVVRSLTQKLDCPPTAILLAENDEAVDG